jgi:4-hydroxy-tetrahydrodipicolinate reductase
MTRVVVAGAAGRMGSEVCRLLPTSEGIELVGGVEIPGHPLLGTRLGTGSMNQDLGSLITAADVVVDFSTPAAMIANLRTAASLGKPFVSGVTGLDQAQVRDLEDCSRRSPVVHAPNFSVGVNVLCQLAAEAAKRLGPDYDVEVIETHHRQKRDAPSGTAMRLVDVIRLNTRRNRLSYGRKGVPGAKPEDEIGISSVRTGDVVGDHTVVFGGPGERIELTHRATSRGAFASGVLAAVRFVLGRSPGLYSLDDVLASR